MSSIVDGVVRQIKDKLPLSSIVSRKVQLKREGRRVLGLCPFHNEKTPSFSVDDEKGYYYCFGCHAKGDVFQFLLETERLEFREALGELAVLAGISLPSKGHECAKNMQAIYSAIEAAASWFQSKLKGQISVLQYLENRNVSCETIRIFRIGYAPEDGRELIAHLLRKGFLKEDMINAGLLTAQGHSFFRDRIIFPIFDSDGSIIAFGGRSLYDKQPKYINSAESILFKKSEILYGSYLLQKEVKQLRHVLIVEGYMDVLALHQSGIRNVVSPLGTSLSTKHIEEFWQRGYGVTICMDGDIAGRRAAAKLARAVLPLIKADRSIKFIVLDNNMDPHDICVRIKDQKNIMRIFAKSLLLSEFLWLSVVEEMSVDDVSKMRPEQYISLEKSLLDCVAQIRQQNLARHYKEFFRAQITRLKHNHGCVLWPEKREGINILQNVDKECERKDMQLCVLLWIAITFPDVLNHPLCYEQFASFNMGSSSRMSLLQQHIIRLKNNLSDCNIKCLLEEKGFANEIHYIFQKTKNIALGLTNITVALISWRGIMMEEELRLLKIEEKEKRGAGDIVLANEYRERIMQLTAEIIALEI